MENITIFFIIAIIMKISLVLDGRPMEGVAENNLKKESIGTSEQKAEGKKPSESIGTSEQKSEEKNPSESIGTSEQKSEEKNPSVDSNAVERGKGECPVCQRFNNSYVAICQCGTKNDEYDVSVLDMENPYVLALVKDIIYKLDLEEKKNRLAIEASWNEWKKERAAEAGRKRGEKEPAESIGTSEQKAEGKKPSESS